MIENKVIMNCDRCGEEIPDVPISTMQTGAL